MRLLHIVLVTLPVLSDAPILGQESDTIETVRATFAVMRRDGVMLPFAAFNGKRWSTPWPAELRYLELPINLEAVPKGWWGSVPPASWTLWTMDGPQPVEPRAPVPLRIHCSRRIGIRTIYRPAVPPPSPMEQPYPKDGLVVSGGVTVTPINVVSPSAPAWPELEASLRSAITAAEEKALSGIAKNDRWTHPVKKPLRAAVAPRLEAWYSAALDQHGLTLSWIEAVKKYPPGPYDEGCGLETFVTGWVQHNAGAAAPTTELSAAVTYCDRQQASFMLPLGIVKVQQRLHWVFQLSGWDHEWYEVVQLEASGRRRYVVEYHAGAGSSCRP